MALPPANHWDYLLEISSGAPKWSNYLGCTGKLSVDLQVRMISWIGFQPDLNPEWVAATFLLEDLLYLGHVGDINVSDTLFVLFNDYLC